MSRIRRVLVIIAAMALMLPAMLFNTAALTKDQEYFFETIGPMAQKDAEKSGILASVTLAQAIQESGWANSKMAQTAKNLFGIKAYKTNWTGKVYCSANYEVYKSFDDAAAKLGESKFNEYYGGSNYFYRAYNDFSQSVADHGEFLNVNPRYEALVGVEDYKKACYLLLECGYASSTSYATKLIEHIEDYELYKYDSVQVGNPVKTVAVNKSELNLKIGDVYTVKATVSPSSADDTTIKFKSSDTAVATVDQKGKITALKSGVAEITATSVNGKTASVAIYCSEEDVVTYRAQANSAIKCRTTPNSSSSNKSIFTAGSSIVIFGSIIDEWYLVAGWDSNGNLIYGYSYASYITKKSEYECDIKRPDKNILEKPTEPETPKKEMVFDLSAEAEPEPIALELFSENITRNPNIVLVSNENEESLYYVIEIKSGVKTIDGWCEGSYISLQKGTLNSENEIAKQCFINSNGYFCGINPGTDAAEIYNLYDEPAVSLYNTDGEDIPEGAALKTGDIIKITIGDELILESEIVIKGDITGDSRSGSDDVEILRNYLIQKEVLEGCYLDAADINGDGTVDSMDYIMLLMNADIG